MAGATTQWSFRQKKYDFFRHTNNYKDKDIIEWWWLFYSSNAGQAASDVATLGLSVRPPVRPCVRPSVQQIAKQ